MKGKFKFYGVKSQERRALTRTVIKEVGLPSDESFEDVVQQCWNDDHREVQYAAMDLVDRKKWFRKSESIELIEWMIVTRSWWDTVDFIASTLCGSYFKHHPKQIAPLMRRWNTGDNMWLVRASILFQLKYKSEVDPKLLAQLITPHLGSEEFFIQKAIGWALRQHSKFNPEFVRKFIAEHPLKPVSLREAKKYV